MITWESCDAKNTAARERITAELLADAGRTDRLIATVSGSSQCLAWTVRRELEASGLIAPVPPAERASHRDRQAVQPTIPDLPRQPDFSAGRYSSPSVDPDWWSSFSREERQAARHVCGSCPLLLACREWSLSLPVTDTTIYGGWTAAERVKRKQERAQAEAEAARLSALRGMPKINATKITCKHGHDISPGSPNVRIDTWGRGKPMRVCLTCKRIRKRLARRRDQPAAA